MIRSYWKQLDSQQVAIWQLQVAILQLATSHWAVKSSNSTVSN